MGSITEDNYNEQQSSREKALKTNLSLLKMLQSRKYSNVEIERLTADIECISRRLGSREYKQSDFKPRNTLLIPDRTDEIVNDLAFYWSVGKVWQSVLAIYLNHRHITLAEYGCGHISKVGLGLIYNNFLGHLTLVDADSNALQRARDCLTFFGSKFLCSCSAQSIYSEASRQYDAIVANHLLDDLILDWHCRLNNISIESLYQSEQLYINSWEQILSNPDLLEQLPRKLASSLCSSLKPGGTLIMLDYPSFSHKALGLKAVISLVKKTQKKLLKELLQLAFKPAEHAITEISYGRLKIKAADLIVAKKPGGSDGF